MPIVSKVLPEVPQVPEDDLLLRGGDDPLGLAASDIAYHNFLSGSIAGNTRAFFHSHRIASNSHLYYTTDQHQIATVPAEYLLIKEKDSLSGLSFCECLNGELLDYSQFELLYA